jgi:eukaryotic-like serine/threonine-protein kinase
MPVSETGRLLADRYLVIRPLGSGGMATVFLAEDTRLGRRVAVKRLHAHSPDDMALRFKREAKLGASMNHPNLVSVFDTVTDDEGVLIVMEYVEGLNLAETIRREGRLEPRRAIAILRGAAAALDEAHRQGVVHRDVKPANILIGRGDTAKLADLGIGKATEGTRITREGSVLGTPSYMAPEQLEGGTAGPPADIYALAAVAFEALAGVKAVAGKTPVEIAHKVAAGPPPDLRDAWAAAPEEAAMVLQRGMARDPGERPPTAGRLIDELEDSLAPLLGEPTPSTAPLRHEPTPAAAHRATLPPSFPASRTVYGTRSKRSWLPVAAILAGMLAIGIVIGLAGGGDDGGGGQKAASSDRATKDSGKSRDQGQQNDAQPPAEQPHAEQPAVRTDFAQGGPEDASLGARLNDAGFAQMNSGDYKGAAKTLKKAVRAFPAGSDPVSDISYAYALFNLGKSLNRSGKPKEAIPYLEARAQNPNQAATVQAELASARRAAGE